MMSPPPFSAASAALFLFAAVAAASEVVVNSSGEAVAASGTAVAATAAPSSAIVPQWRGKDVRDLHQEYGNIFKYGNRNAASHLWSSFLLDRAAQFTPERLAYFFSGFCAVSGSPVGPGDHNRYRLNLPNAAGGGATRGYMHYCCWPCVCDTQDFIRVDTKTVVTAEGPKQFNWAVIGNPCDQPQKLHEPFFQPFDGRNTTIAREAAEVRCDADGHLIGATLSDHGFPILSMFFDAEGATGASQQHQDETLFAGMCSHRAANGYNSGMGEIFRKVSAMSPIKASSADDNALPALEAQAATVAAM